MDERDCVVVGGGPGGVVLAYLLARQGLRVTLLEARADFARRFRGDSLAPAVMDYLDELGLGADVLARPHATADAFTWHSRTPDGGDRAYRVADYSTASPRHPHYVLLPQPEFLGLVTDRAAQFPGFRLEFSARVNELVEEDGRVVGVRYRAAGGTVREVRAPLVVGADGRFSQVRRLGGFESEELGAGLDILWSEVPRRAGDPDLSGLDYYAVPGAAIVALGQGATWQLGYVIPTGTVAQAREAGIGPVVELARDRMPWLGDRLDALTAFTDLTLLNVRITRLPSWYRPGLLLLGDAAHVISPVGGNGINIAIADAADAGNTLAPVLAGTRHAPDRTEAGPGDVGGAEAAGTADRRDGVDPGALDRACAAFEVRRRAVSDVEQRSQVRAERGSLERMRRGDPRPVWILRLAAAVPAVARALGRRSASAIAIPAPSAAVLAARSPGDRHPVVDRRTSRR
jgi:2-polyprenyl-6-methoxyphenol hydroxylase-like FAD-dependent oxidoreductase